MKPKTPLIGWRTTAWNKAGTGHLFRESMQGGGIVWSVCGQPSKRHDLQTEIIKKCARCEKAESKFTAE